MTEDDPVPTVNSYDDAVLFLSYMVRFGSRGTVAETCGGCLNVLTELRKELDATKQRCASLAKLCESLELSMQERSKS